MHELQSEFKKNGGRFQEYKLGDLFAVKSNPQLNKESFTFSDKAKYPYFTRTVSNNGILGYVEYLDKEHLIPGNSLAVGMLGMNFFYMKHDFYAGQYTKTVFPKFENFNERIALFFISLLNKFQRVFQGVLVRDFESVFNNSDVILPTNVDGKIAFGYMEKYIAALESERIAALESERIAALESERIAALNKYLAVSGLDNTELKPDELRVLSDFRNGKVQFKQFKIGDLFEKCTFRKKKFNKSTDVSKVQTAEFNLPLVNAKNGDNGIMYYGRKSDFDCESMTIDIVNDGAVSTGNVYPQPQETGVLYNAYLIKFTEYSIKEQVLMYLAQSIQKSIKLKFGYDKKASWDRVQEEKIVLPITAVGDIDYEFMGRFMSAQQKLAICDVVAWKDTVIDKTRQVLAGVGQ